MVTKKLPLDALVDYNTKMMHRIGSDEMVAKLLLNKSEVDLDGPDGDELYDGHIFDYNYVDDIDTAAGAYVCVETELYNQGSDSMNVYRLYVKVACHKSCASLDPSIFPGVAGNRRDNLLRYIDRLLNRDNTYGVGQLTLVSARTVVAPVGFTARELTYEVPDLSR